MALITNNISGSASNLSQIGITGSVIIANRSPATFPAFPGTDVTFFVSGSTGVADGKSVFGGDLVISGSGQFFGNVLEVTGAINMSGTMHVSGVFRSGYSTFNVNDYTHTEGSVTFAADVYSVITSVDTGLNEITVEDASIFAIGDKVAYVYNAGGNGNQVHITEVTNSDNVTIVTVAAAVSINGSSFNALSNAVTGGASVLINLSQVNETRTFAHAEGSYTIASGLNSHAEGRKTAATGNHSHAEGVVSLSSGLASHAEGNGTLASGDSSHAEGGTTKATGTNSHAEGDTTQSIGFASHAEGYNSIAEGDYSHAEGESTKSFAQSSHVEGYGTIASGSYSHAENYQTIAYSNSSHAEGYQTYAGGRGYTATSVVAGVITLDSSYGDVSAEIGTTLLLDDSFGADVYTQRLLIVDTTTPGTPTIITLKDLSISTTGARVAPSNTGFPTTAGTDVEISRYSHSEGYRTHAHGMSSHAEGVETRAQGWGSHVEGYFSAANGKSSHAEGAYTVSIGEYSHAEGDTAYSYGNASHAEGSYTRALSSTSHAEGAGTFAGFYGYSAGVSAGVITLDSSYGNVTSQFQAGTYLILDDTPYDNIYQYLVLEIASVSFTTSTVITLVDTGITTTTAIIGVEGNGSPTSADKVLSYSILGGSHAEGVGTIAHGPRTHAEGEDSTASGLVSHAEGYLTIARGNFSHAEGVSTIAQGNYSHAEGYTTIALAAYSHAAGQETIASGSAQTVVGRHNLRDNNFSLFVVGNGTGDSNGLRSDAIRVNAESTQISGSFFQRNSGSSAVGFMGSDTAALPSAKGPDVFFYVSGTVGAKENAVVGTALFGGDVVVSGSLFAEGDTFEVTGSLTVTNGISGSLTKLSTGASYLVAGPNVTITSQSNGQVTIAASAAPLQFLAGTVSSQAPSSSMGSIGMDYLDTTSLPPAPTYTFSAILATTAGTTAYMDLYDYDGIIGGTPNPIAGAVLTGSSTSYTYLTADVTSALSLAGSSGIIEARIWCSPTGSGLNAICKSAKLTIS